MTQQITNKRKILNDPVYGFISLPFEIIHDLIEHPWFQRLRRIKQVGMTHMVYPGALHTRFHHALGAMHLMSLAISSIRDKGHEISPAEAEGACIAILLHDIGHGPFSHTLEYTLTANISHEQLSVLYMQRLNEEFNGKLTLGIEIFNNNYKKKFLHQLVSSQLDMDRLDYLTRDSFYTGVSEGVVSNQRIIKMLNVHNDQLVVEEKGIYSIEKFLVARRLMYWQVYLHKTVIVAEQMLIKILQRAKELASRNVKLFASPALQIFLNNDYTFQDFQENRDLLVTFADLDDFDIMGAIKVWQNSEDKILSGLCAALLHRKLYKVKLQNVPFEKSLTSTMKNELKKGLDLTDEELSYVFLEGSIENNAYNPKSDLIHILMKTGEVKDIAEASDYFTFNSQTQVIKKYFICYPKTV